jgi:hypothetical protein
VWIALVVPPAMLLLAVLLQWLEDAVLAAPNGPDPRDADRADLPEPAGSDPPARPAFSVLPDPAAPSARPDCAAYRRPAAATRVTA